MRSPEVIHVCGRRRVAVGSGEVRVFLERIPDLRLRFELVVSVAIVRCSGVPAAWALDDEDIVATGRGSGCRRRRLPSALSNPPSTAAEPPYLEAAWLRYWIYVLRAAR